MPLPRRLLIVGIVGAAGAAGALVALVHAPTRQALALATGLAEPLPAPVQPPYGVLDRPVEETLFSTTLKASGWVLDSRGIESVAVRIAGKTLDADYGLPRTDVASAHPEFPRAERAGFAIERSLPTLRPLRFPFEIVATNVAGVTTSLGRRSLVPPGAMRLWEPWADDGSRAFHVLMAMTGIGSGAPDPMQRSFQGYISGTHRVGIVVPILYMRTTRGRAADWEFDPAFDVGRRCGDQPLAHDALQEVLRHAARAELPVQFSLDAGGRSGECRAPDWDLGDRLAETASNLAWTRDDKPVTEAQAKDPSAIAAPPRRSLTLNVHAHEVRRYWKRNLQQAARSIAAFARQHPHLVVGVDLADPTIERSFDAPGRLDYHPGTLRQFREWLRGEGPYADRNEGEPADLRAFRRSDPLTLAEVNRLAGAKWKRWDEVDPPGHVAGPAHGPPAAGARPVDVDPWLREWEAFHTHLLAVHRDQLAQWTQEAGIPAERIFTAQAFTDREGMTTRLPQGVSATEGGSDGHGVRARRHMPRHAHLGAILHGPGSGSGMPMQHRHGSFAALARADPGWAVVEAKLADARAAPDTLPYAEAYRTFRDLFNFDARQIALMSAHGAGTGHAGPRKHVAYTALRNTPVEEALRDHLVSHAGLPLGSRLWTFGSAQHVDDDGWTSEGATAHADRARLVVEPESRRLALVSPPDQVVRRNNAQQLVIGVDRKLVSRVQAWGRQAPDAAWTRWSDDVSAATLRDTPAGLVVPLHWPSGWREDAIATQVRVTFTLPRQDRPLNVDRIALIGRLAPRTIGN